MQSDTPLFSICVPTRNRAETLHYCLKTLLHQDFNSYEIVVSDNSDEEQSRETLSVVKALDSDKIRYVRPDRVLSMTENFEFALEKAAGTYLLFMGDDDGLVVNSLGYVADIQKTFEPSIIKCPGVIYYWPGSSLREDPVLCYPYARPHLWLNGKESLRQVFSFDINYYILPMIYYAFVHRDLITKVKKVGGTFFQDSISPDIYSGIVLAHYEKEYMISSRPFTIAGLSAKSNGVNSMKGEKNTITEEFKKQQNTVGKFDKFEIPFLIDSGFENTVLFELMLFMENHSIEPKAYEADLEKFLMKKPEIGQILNRPESFSLPPQYRESSLFNEKIKKLETDVLGKQMYIPRFGSFSNLLVHHTEIETDLFHLQNVYDAATLCEEIAQNHTSFHPIPLKNVDHQLKVRRKKRMRKELNVLKERVSYYLKRLFLRAN